MPAKSAADAAPMSDTVRVKVREKADGLISKGSREDHRDLSYAKGDIFDAHPSTAEVLAFRDLVDYVD